MSERAVIEVRREAPGYGAILKVGSDGIVGSMGRSILGVIDDLKESAKSRDLGEPTIQVTDGIEPEYIAEIQAEQAHKSAAEIQEALEFFKVLTKVQGTLATDELAYIVSRAKGEIELFIRELEKDMESMGYRYNDETEEAEKLEEAK